MTNLPKIYAPQEIEGKWYQFWLKNDYFHAAATSEKQAYAIVIPPPNITGSLHIGHALDNTLQDCLIRWRRMQGYNTLWMPGTDHAGIVTELIMERKLAEEGTSRIELGREKFTERMWQWKAESAGYIVSQLQQLGCSCDWERERFTLDEGLSKAVRTAFVKLYNQGLIYRDTYMVNWCPECNTAISNLEVEPIEIDGNFYHIRYPVKDSDVVLEIATTRPETMLGDTAVAVHPDDERYQHVIGKTARLPLCDREIPIIADAYVDREFGTGALKVTPAHDPNDYEIGLRHELEQCTIFTQDGHISEAAPEKYVGLSRWDCRKQVVEDLQNLDHLVKIVPHRHAVGHHDRCGAIVEPAISLQWFMNVRPLAQRAIEATQKGEVRFIPERETDRFYHWMEIIEPWPISRQRWWGHQLPIWYCNACDAVTAAMETPHQCKCGASDFRQDEDVLDTWFSSGLWPFSTMGWPEETEELKTFYPTSVLVSGWDILFFWVSRMIMLGLGCMDKVPFQTVYLHGLVADEKGQKMSKSKGNTIDPLETIDTYGTDAFRFALANVSTPIPYVSLSEPQIESGRRFANKIWNAARFILMNLEKHPIPAEVDAIETEQETLEITWIRSRLSHTIKTTTDALENFRFYEATQTLYAFLWHEFCDWYLEFTKQRIAQDDPAALWVATDVLEQTMRLLHPLMPFLTEEIWQQLPLNRTQDDKSVTIAPWPEPTGENSTAETTMATLTEVIESIRSIRGELNVPIGASVAVHIQSPNSEVRERLETYLSQYLPAFTRVADITIAESLQKPPASAEAVIGELAIYIPLADVIDLEAEQARLSKRHQQAVKDVTAAQKTLDNPNFVERAPEKVVAQKRAQLERLLTEQDKLARSLAMLTESGSENGD
ncbi:valine--tRNA ligase [Candidatus Poribacteria bacterium]|nr:valine--tRNA ligase [Candidatus Poribacteria bacterium]MYB01101.1 valine--tRNA ligase [Candidatus Poribacteria bacterium]